MLNRFALIRIVAVALLLYSLWSLYSSYGGIKSAEQLTAELQTELALLQEKNAELKQNTEKAESGELMEKLAREKLGYILPGERVFYFTDSPGEQP